HRLPSRKADTPPQADRKSAEPTSSPAPRARVKDIKELKAERKERKEDIGKYVVIEELNNWVIVKEGTKLIIRADETEAFGVWVATRVARSVMISTSRSTFAPGGFEIFTETDDRGRALRRYRRDRSGREVVLFDNRTALNDAANSRADSARTQWAIFCGSGGGETGSNFRAVGSNKRRARYFPTRRRKIAVHALLCAPADR
ncbi:MAG: hypothetical protein ACXW48_23065, partial [Candidatus Binatia bacterium]